MQKKRREEEKKKTSLVFLGAFVPWWQSFNRTIVELVGILKDDEKGSGIRGQGAGGRESGRLEKTICVNQCNLWTYAFLIRVNSCNSWAFFSSRSSAFFAAIFFWIKEILNAPKFPPLEKGVDENLTNRSFLFTIYPHGNKRRTD